MSIRSLRQARNVSQEKLAEYIGVSPSMISRYERSLSIPPADKVVKMAEFLQTSVDSIMDYRRNVIDSDGSPNNTRDPYSQLSDDKVILISSTLEDIVINIANGTCELCRLSFQQNDFWRLIILCGLETEGSQH